MKHSEARILLVEDDPNLGFVTRDSLLLQGYEVDLFPDGEQAERAFSLYNYDLCILDVMLPAMDGFVLARKIRKKNPNIPILFLTAKSQKEDRLEGFRTGGDDYISKPFHLDELIMRMEVFLRRSRKPESRQLYQIGNVTLDAQQYLLICNGFRTSLTDKETRLLMLLMDQKGQVVKREDILNRIWGNDDYFMGRSLDVFISRLRKYLKESPQITIKNLHGIGFSLIVTK